MEPTTKAGRSLLAASLTVRETLIEAEEEAYGHGWSKGKAWGMVLQRRRIEEAVRRLPVTHVGADASWDTRGVLHVDTIPARPMVELDAVLALLEKEKS